MAVFCKHCGKELKEGAKFCSGCGQHAEGAGAGALAANAAVPESTGSVVSKDSSGSARKRSTMINVIAILSGIVVAGGAVALFAPHLFQKQEGAVGDKEPTVASGYESTIEESASKASHGDSEKEADTEQDEAASKEAELAALAYQEFLQNERTAQYKAMGNDEQYYLSTLLDKYIDYVGRENVACTYSFINPERQQKEILLIQIGMMLEESCYVVVWQDGELYIHEFFTMLDGNHTATVTKYGLIKEYAGLPDDSCGHSTGYIDQDGKIQWINDYRVVDPFDMGLWGKDDLMSQEARTILEATEAEVCKWYTDKEIADFSNAISIHEYAFDNKFYYVISGQNDTLICEEYVSLCQNQGMNLVSEAEIRQMQEEQSQWLEEDQAADSVSSLTWITYDF